MPELPEVQTIVSELDKKISGKKIVKVLVNADKVAQPSKGILISKLPDKTVKSVKRRAKMIVIDLGGDHNLLIHLKMTGQLVYVQKNKKAVSGGHPIGVVGVLPNKFSHIIIHFSDGSVLYFNDIRKFGWVRYVDNQTADKEKAKYGIEPFDREYTFKNFDSLLNRYPKRKIKQFLLDQSLISGIGNIYADESCFSAKILPTHLAGKLTLKQKKDLFEAIPRILKMAIAKGGTSADNYVRTDGTKGGMIKYLNVYGRKDLPCPRCHQLIKKIKLNGRGTHFCEKCQS